MKDNGETSAKTKAMRALPEGAVPDALDIKRCGLQTVVRDDNRKVR